MPVDTRDVLSPEDMRQWADRLAGCGARLNVPEATLRRLQEAMQAPYGAPGTVEINRARDACGDAADWLRMLADQLEQVREGAG